MRQFDAVVVSDLHLGARNSRREAFLAFLDWVETPHLILAGDVFDDPRWRRLTTADLAVVERLRELCCTTRVTWLRGNHDPSAEWYRALMGIAPADEVLVDVGGRPYLVCHGHLWDHTLAYPSWVIFVAEMIYRGAQCFDRSHRLARNLKHASRRFRHTIDTMTDRAWQSARQRQVAGIVWGHSHVACDRRQEDLHLLNTGCWTEIPSGFVGIRGATARTYYWDELAPQAETVSTSSRERPATWRLPASTAAAALPR